MPREGSNLQENFEQRRPIPTGMSNSFNPSMSQRAKTPLPAINKHQNIKPVAVVPSKNMSSIINDSIHDETDLVLPTKVFQAKKTSVKDLSQALCSYLWFRRIKEIFLVMGKQNNAFTRFDMELARNDMIQTCEQYIESERPKMSGINLSKPEQDKLNRWKHKRLYGETFRMSYFRKETDSGEKTVKVQTFTQTELSSGEAPNFDNAIWWYSCNEAPIFDQMNNILRLENFELLMCHRYYISDLCQMIERSYIQNRVSQKQIVYRADKLSVTDFEIIKQSTTQKDARITINGFISTSRNEKISLEYAADKLKKKRANDIVIMYEITIDPALPCSAYADIQSISFHPREEEVLFNMGSTFQIDSLGDDPNNPDIKRIKLTARDFNLTLLDEMKAKVKQASQATLSILLVRYMIELGEDRVCKRYLSQLIESKQLENDPNLVAVYNCLGTIHSRQALYGEALEYYRKALNTQARLQFSNNNALAEIFNNIGQTHLGLNQLEEAKQNLEEGIRIQKREPKHSQQHLASLYCNLGQVAYAQRDWNEAESHFESAYDLYNQSSKISHDALEKRLLKADLCIAFGHLKSVKNCKNPTEATEKFNEALKIYECILPLSHPKVAEAHIDIVCEYTRNKNYQAVINYQDEHFLSLLKDYENKYTTSQLDLANLYANIGACFAHQKEFNKAMEIWKKGLEHEQKVFFDELLSSARVSKIQQSIRIVESAYRTALEYYLSNTDAPKEYLAILYAKMYSYDKVLEILRGQSSFLLANVCVSQRNLKGSMIVYKRILELEKPDTTLLIALLLRILTVRKITSNEEPITELLRIENSLKSVADNEAIRLRMIINDYLAESYLAEDNYKSALECSQTSFELKQRLYSSYHPSLIRNYQLVASCNFQQKDYKNAVQYYEKAIEIQMDNMSSGHPKIRANYFLMGDCYCRMDKLELATEFYDQAQAPNESENDDEKETEQDIKALLRMYSHLSEVLAQQKDFTTASIHQQTRIDTLKEILPTFIVELLEDEEATNITMEQLQTVVKSRLGLTNSNTFAQVLRNFVFIRLCLARTLLQAEEDTDDDEDATDLFEQAIELQLKLTLFESNDEQDLTYWYEELGNAYDKLYSCMKETTRDNLIKALEETTNSDRQRSIEFRLGNLYYDEENFTEADRYWKSALEKVKDDQTTIKTVIQKLIEKNKVNLSNSKANSDGDDEEEEEEEEEEEKEEEKEEKEDEEQDVNERHVQSAKSQRRLSTKSFIDKEKLEEIAQAYLDLNDDRMALKYFKRHISKLEETLTPTWSQTEFQSEQLPMIKLFYSFLTEAIHSLSNSTQIPDKNIWINLLQAYMKTFTIAVRMADSFDQVSGSMVAMFDICQKLYEVPNNLITLFDLIFKNELSDDLQWNPLADLIPPAESIIMFMKIGQYHLSNQDWTKALHIYRLLQDNIHKQVILQCAINYGILKLLESYIVVDEEYRPNIMVVDIHSSSIPIFDRIILCRLIISYMTEMENNEGTSQFKKELVNLQKEVWTNITLKETDGIGQTLVKFDQSTLACWYWTEVQTLYNETLPNSIVTRLYSTDSTFEQIYRAVQEMNNDLYNNIISLVQSYEKMSEYEEKGECIDDACQSLEKAIVIWKKIPLFKERFQQLQMKVEKLKTE
ncbi:unnamed protein product [Rotaria sordida]|uniref:ADP ribosyltransferase domain-containing protein n=1 Tax=Rotaria sordida TaxID=392033 RepID=A0A814CBT1_9BILA|nr:unnamed protein product [Rotaria sordida]